MSAKVKTPGTSMSDVLEKLLVNLAEDKGAKTLKTANFTADDDGEGAQDLADIPKANIYKANEKGIASIGGGDTGGMFKFDFDGADAQAQAQAFTAEAKDLMQDFNALLTGAQGGDAILGRSDVGGPGENVLEALLARTAQAFGGTARLSDIKGDSLNDAVNYEGRSALRYGGSTPEDDATANSVSVANHQVTGALTFTFDDHATAEKFYEVARLLLDFGGDYF